MIGKARITVTAEVEFIIKDGEDLKSFIQYAIVDCIQADGEEENIQVIEDNWSLEKVELLNDGVVS